MTFAELPVEESPIFQAERVIKQIMWPFKPGHIYLEVREDFKSWPSYGACIVVKIERLQYFPCVVEIGDSHANEILDKIAVAVEQHFAGIRVPVDDHIQLGEE